MQFTIRRLLSLVAIVAALLALLPLWREVLPIVIVVDIPITSLCGLLTEVPLERPSWRRCISAALLGVLILAGGWLWARLVIWHFQRLEGHVVIAGATLRDDYPFWGLLIPSCVTGVCLVVYVSILACACIPRHRRDLLWLVVGYAAYLSFAWSVLFGDLDLEAFSD